MNGFRVRQIAVIWRKLHISLGASPVAQMVKHLPTRRETWVQFLGQEDPLEKEMVIHSSTFAWKIPWMEERGGLQSMGSQRVGRDWATSLSLWIRNLDRKISYQWPDIIIAVQYLFCLSFGNSTWFSLNDCPAPSLKAIKGQLYHWAQQVTQI